MARITTLAERAYSAYHRLIRNGLTNHDVSRPALMWAKWKKWQDKRIVKGQ